MCNVQFVKRSKNAKVGPIPITNSSRETCPDSCPLKGAGGCYAEAGFHTRLNWDKVTSGERGGDWKALCDQVAALPEGQVWRHNVAGDLPMDYQGSIDAESLGMLATANEGRRGFTYTHHEVLKHHENRSVIRWANEDGFTVNLSADNLADADAKASLGIAPVTVVLPETQVTNTQTPAGRKVVICPAAIRDGVSCATCKLCAIPDRKAIVGFPAHGSRKAVAATH